MPRTHYNKFNRGEVDPQVMVRDDVEEVHNTCELMENWLPKRGGWMQYRAGTEYVGLTKENTSHLIVPFVDDGETPTVLEFSQSDDNPSVESLRIWINDALLTITATADSLSNSGFASDLADWSDDSAGSGATAWSSEYGGSAKITGGTADADNGILYQTVSTTAGKRTVELFVSLSPCLVQIGYDGVGSNDIFKGILSVGYHLLTFNSDGSNITYTLSNDRPYPTYIEYFAYKATGTFELSGSFFFDTSTNATVLPTVRYTQVNDVLFLTSAGYYQEGKAHPVINIRRWGLESWSFEVPDIIDGPFGALNESSVTLTPSATDGLANLTASEKFFVDPTSVGKFYKIVHGGTEGICQVISVTSSTVAAVRVVQTMGATTATADWYEGLFGLYLPSPTTVDVYQNRLWLAGGARIYGSVSDLYLSFDGSLEGDAASIQKTIAVGPVQNISWLAGGDELFIGLTAEELRVTSTADYEAVTQNNITLRRGTNRGSANVQSVIVDGLIYFVQRGLQKLMTLTGLKGDDIVATELTSIHPTITSPGIKRIAYVSEPESRMFVLLTDGTLRVLTFDRIEAVTAWSRITIGGGATIVDIATVPTTSEDKIYFIIERDGTRSIERFSDEADAVGQSDSRHFDSHVYEASPGGTFSGLDHLEGVGVKIWADGRPRGGATVNSGSITLQESDWTDVVVGVQHTAKWRSNRLARYVDESVFNYRKRIKQMGLIAKSLALRTFQYGADEDHLNFVPDVRDGRPQAPTGSDEATIAGSITGVNEGPMDINAIEVYGDYLVCACDSIPSPPEVDRYQLIVYHEADQKVYIVGGDDGGIKQDDMWKFDPVDAVLTQLNDLPNDFGEHSISIDTVNGKIYVLGSNGGGADDFAVYDIATDSFDTVDSTGLTVLPHAASAYYDGKVYLFGGSSSGTATDNFSIYDIGTDTWDHSPSVTGSATARYHHGMCIPQSGIGAGNIFIFGGSDGSAPTDLTAFELYSITTATWSSLSNTGQQARERTRLAAPGDDFIYNWGGKERVGTATYDQTMYVYDIDATSWSFFVGVPTPAPSERVNFGMCANTDKRTIYVHGGEGRNATPAENPRHKDFWEYTPAGDGSGLGTWTEIAQTVSPAAGGIRTFDKSDYEELLSVGHLNMVSDLSGDDLRGYSLVLDRDRKIAFVITKEDDDSQIERGIVAVDVSDPANMVQLGYLEGGTHVTTIAKGMAYDGRYVYTFSFELTNGQLCVIDAGDPTGMELRGTLNLSFINNAVNPESVVLDGNTLYVFWESKIHVVDVSNPDRPKLVTEINKAGIQYTSTTSMVVRDGEFFYSASPAHGAVHCWQRTSKTTFEWLGTYDNSTDLQNATDLLVFHPYAYLHGPTKAAAIDFTVPTAPTAVAIWPGYTGVTSIASDRSAVFFSGSTTSSGILYASDVRSWDLVDYDEMSFEFNGTFDTDSRVYLQATGPATILALTFEIEDADQPQRGSDGPGTP